MATIFMCHRSPDKSEVEKLATALRGHGHDVRYDAWELLVGDSILGWMSDALAAAAIVLVCYSSQPNTGPYYNREWEAALDAQLSGKKIRVIPVKLTGAVGPFILRGIREADWMGNPTQALDELLRAIAKHAGP